MSQTDPINTDPLYWESLLEEAGLGNPDKPWYGALALRSDLVDEQQAKPVRNGGFFWHNKGLIHHARQDRKRVPATRHVCRTCGAGFWGTKRAVYCSHKCNALFDIRRRRYLARAVGGNLPIDSEGL